MLDKSSSKQYDWTVLSWSLVVSATHIASVMESIDNLHRLESWSRRLSSMSKRPLFYSVKIVIQLGLGCASSVRLGYYLLSPEMMLLATT